MRCLKATLILLLAAMVARTQGVVHLKTRDLAPSVGVTPGVPPTSPAFAQRHFLILFDSYPGPDVIAELQSRRVQVLAYVPENALMVSAAKLNVRGLDVQWSGPMDPADKLSPVVTNQPWGSYLVIWHPDTDIDSDASLAESLGFSVVTNSQLLPSQLLISGAYSALPALAALDQVAYILPASAGLQNGDAIAGCSGPTTRLGPSPQYVKANNGWTKDSNGQVALGYYFESVTPKVPESQVRSEIARAFAAWTQVANISISPAAGPGLNRTIDILFARYAHGDAYPFTGPGGVIAHTFYPLPSNPEPLAGDMHFNADEPWSVGGSVDIFSVALHEIGHALGLAHSDDPSSVMYPYYRLQTALTPDDIAGIQSLYGPPASTPPPAPGNGSSTTSGSTNGSVPGGVSSAPTTPATPSTPSAGSADTIAPTLAIVTPGSSMISTGAATIVVSGTANDNVKVASVQWTTSTGGAGTASGTTAWSATIPLLVGNNTVTVRAYDAAGNSSWRAVTVVRN